MQRDIVHLTTALTKYGTSPLSTERINTRAILMPEGQLKWEVVLCLTSVVGVEFPWHSRDAARKILRHASEQLSEGVICHVFIYYWLCIGSLWGGKLYRYSWASRFVFWAKISVSSILYLPFQFSLWNDIVFILKTKELEER